MVWSQLFLYDDAWFVIQDADVRVCAEQFERLRRGGITQPAACNPWETVRDGRLGQRVVQRELIRPDVIYLTRTKSPGRFRELGFPRLGLLVRLCGRTFANTCSPGHST